MGIKNCKNVIEMAKEIFNSTRSPILFGENLRVGCTFPISRSKLSASECEGISRRAMAALLGSGNSDGYVPITNLVMQKNLHKS